MGSTSFLDIAKQRYSCRTYTNQPIEHEKLMRVLEAGRIAPSAVNYQPWHFIVVSQAESLQNLYECYPQDWFKAIPCAIVVCGDHHLSWKRKDHKDFCDIDIAIAADHMTMQAVTEELATCWVCNFDAQMLSQKLNLPSNIEPVVILPIGYPQGVADVNRYQTKRKSNTEIIHFEKFEI